MIIMAKLSRKAFTTIKIGSALEYLHWSAVTSATDCRLRM